MSPATTAPGKLTPAQRAQVQAWCDEFGRGWTDQGLAARVKSLPPAGDVLRLPTLIGLVQVDLAKQWQQNRRPTIEGFLHFYPELGTRDSVAVELIHAEYQARQQHGGGANLADFRRRFPNQAEALQRLLVPPAAPKAAPPPAAAAPTAAEPPACKLDRLPAQFGRYKVLQEVGRGGMGVVYRAEDAQTGQRVALKVMHELEEGAGDLLQRFLREARLAAAVSHPNLNPVLDSGAVGGRHFLAMKFIDGQTLADALKRGPLEPRRAVELVRKIALALQSAHAQGIIHRDLKPANIMLDQQGEPIVMDFGLARRSNDVRATVNGQMLGTPAYMPPEQVMGDVDSMGPLCDVYSLGVILYECVTGHPPFQGDVGTVMLSVMKKPPVPPSQARRGLDPRLDALCLRALAKDPENRFASMTAFAAALTSFLEGRAVPQPVVEISPSKVGMVLDRKRAAARRQPRRWPLMVALGGAGIALLGLLWWAASGLFKEVGVVRIEVDDAQAVVLVDGKEQALKQGMTAPLTLPVGKHQVLVRVGEREEVQEVNVRPGKNKSFKAAAPRREAAPPPEEKWVSLFNGKDLTGWKRHEGEAIMFRATDEGTLAVFGPGPGWLVTEQSFSDFELRLEYRLTWRSASGVAVRVPKIGNPSTDGIEVQLIDHSHFTDLRPLEQHGALYQVAQPKTLAGLATGAWHKLVITCRGRRLTATIDETPVLDVPMDERRAYYTSNPGLQNKTGRIGLECQEGSVSFRNIEIKELHAASGRSARATQP